MKNKDDYKTSELDKAFQKLVDGIQLDKGYKPHVEITRTNPPTSGSVIETPIQKVELSSGHVDVSDFTDFDPVNKPVHYNRLNAMECIDEMLMIFGKEAVASFALCNAWKYRYRAASKGKMEQDLEKSDFYMNLYKKIKGNFVHWEELDNVKEEKKINKTFTPDIGLTQPFHLDWEQDNWVYTQNS